eukprot:11824247-Alexandrium_andersonii.AAC.1
MSASLVGSEMCIRDRLPPVHGSNGSRHCQRYSASWSGFGLGGIACPRPVSYTHLTLPTICSV